MVNLYLKTESVEEAVDLANNISKYLKESRAFKDNSIVVSDINGVTCISLGDVEASHFNISAEVVETEACENDATYYLSEPNSSGITVHNKKELLDRISTRIDEILEERGNLDAIEVLIIK